VKKKNIRNIALAPYPAVRLLGFVAGGVLAGSFFPVGVEVWFGMALASLLAVGGALLYEWFLSRSGRSLAVGRFPLPVSTILFLVLVFTAFAAYADLRFNHVPRNGLLPFAGKSIVLSGRVESRPVVSSSGTHFQMEVREVFDDGDATELCDRAAVHVRGAGKGELQIRRGSLVRVKGSVTALGGAGNRGEFNPHQASRLKGVSTSVFAVGVWQVQSDGESGAGWFERFLVEPVALYLENALKTRVSGGRERSFMAGVLAGQRDQLSPELELAFRRTGTAHILAVSGLHVGLLVLVVNLLLQRLKSAAWGRWAAVALTGFILLVYTMVTGGAASVRRASIMAMVVLTGAASGRQSFSLNALALADVIILFLDPLDLFSPGFQMSNAAVLSILLFNPRLNQLLNRGGGGAGRRIWRFVNSSLLLTFAASLGVAPLIAWYFGTFSLIAFVANFPVVLFSSLMLYALFGMLLLNLVSAAAAGVLGAAAQFFAALALDSASFFSSFPFGVVNFRPAAFELLLFFFLLPVPFFFLVRNRWKEGVGVLLVATNIFVWQALFFPPAASPAFLSVNLGRNLSFLFSSGFESIQIDAGRKPSDGERIGRQEAGFGFSSPSALVQLFSPDSLVLGAPSRHHVLRSDSLLVLPSVVIARPAGRVVKLWSRRHSILMASGTGSLQKSELFRADTAVLWIYRFGLKQQRELASWLEYSRPTHCLLVPGGFLKRVDREMLRRFSNERPGVEFRSKDRQMVVWADEPLSFRGE